MSDRVDNLIIRSSLGDPGATALRQRVPHETLCRLVDRVRQHENGREVSVRCGHRLVESDAPHREHGLSQPSGDTTIMLYPGQFTIRSVRQLGVGGLGTVDEVEVIASNASHPIGTRLARKRLGPKWANDPGAQARFEREIEILGTMRHPHVVSLAGDSLPGGERWYVMPLFPRSLRAALLSGGAFGTVTEVAYFVARIADALSYAHGLNFIHRDLKPENILLTDQDEPVVADWGLGQFVHLHSKVLDLTRGGPMGTSYYCSLEQWATGRCGVTGDVYSLGVLLGELLAGTPLPIEPIGTGIRVDVTRGGDAVSRALNAIVRKMTMLTPTARHQSMTEVALALRSAVHGLFATHAHR